MKAFGANRKESKIKTGAQRKRYYTDANSSLGM